MQLKKGIYIFALIGLALGITIDQLLVREIQPVLCYITPSLFALIFSFAYNGRNNIRLIFSSLWVSMFLSAPLLEYKFGVEPEHINHIICFIFAFPVFCYIAQAYHCAFHADNSLRPNYASLFASVWNTIPLVFVASIFLVLGQIIFIFGAYVYQSAGNNFLWSLYFNDYHFRIVTNVTIFFIGLSVGKYNLQIIDSLRLVLLKIINYLFPVLVIISISFMIICTANLISHTQTFYHDLNVLIPLSFFGIVFFNAYFQDGTSYRETANWLKFIYKIYRLVLFAIVILMCFEVFQEFTFDINILLYLITALMFVFIYFISIFMPAEKECKWICKGNIYTSLFFVLALFLLNIPYHPVLYIINPGSLLLN